MSTFLGFNSGIISAGYSITSLQSTFSNILSGYGWQIIRKSIIPTSVIGTFTNPANALDMVSSTNATGTVPLYVGCNIASGFTPTAMYIQAEYSNGGNYSPKTFTLDYSSNGSSWTTLQSFSNQINWTYGERRKFTITGATSQTYWRLNVTAVGANTTCYLCEWCLEDTNGNYLTNQGFFDCIPPTTETIGNSYSRDVLRWLFPSALTSIQFRSIQELLTPTPMVSQAYGATAGAATCSITINGSTASFVGTTGNTSLQNLRGLYESCRNSVDSNFTAYNWGWNTNTLTNNGGLGLFGVQKTPGMNEAWTASNVSVCWKATSAINTPLVQGSLFHNAVLATIDTANGFVYYMQTCSRGIAFATKTTSSAYTPVHACYADNATVIAQLPNSELSSYGLPCTPIELFVGTDNVVANTDGAAYVNHWWGVPASGTPTNVTLPDFSTSSAPAAGIFSHMCIAGQLQDISSSIYFTTQIEMGGESFFQGADAGNQYAIHRLGSLPGINWTILNNSGGGPYVRYTAPYCPKLDWYKYTGSAPANEQILVSASDDFTTYITSTGTSSDTTITVNSTTGFPSTGYIIIEGEIIQYTGITSTTFTGCTRGKYSTIPVGLFTGTTVYISAWFVFMVQGLVFGGYQIPT